jgi:hypothetical protein
MFPGGTFDPPINQQATLEYSNASLKERDVEVFWYPYVFVGLWLAEKLINDKNDGYFNDILPNHLLVRYDLDVG